MLNPRLWRKIDVWALSVGILCQSELFEIRIMVNLVNLYMSRKYKFSDNDKLYFVSFAVINWIDLFVRRQYNDIVTESLAFCQKQKGLELYVWCIMPSHVHLIIGSDSNALHNIMRDLKRHTSETLHHAIKQNKVESRREWMLWMMNKAGERIVTIQAFNYGNNIISQ